MTSKNNN